MSAHQAREPSIQGPQFLFLRRACWEAAIASYSRGFEEGQGVGRGRSRVRLDEFVEDLPPNLTECHESVRQLRGKAIGHHVASQSGQVVELYLGIESNTPSELKISDFFVAVETVLYDLEILDRLEELTTLLRGRVGKRIDELRRQVYEAIPGDEDGVRKAARLGGSWSPPAPPSIPS